MSMYLNREYMGLKVPPTIGALGRKIRFRVFKKRVFKNPLKYLLCRDFGAQVHNNEVYGPVVFCEQAGP